MNRFNRDDEEEWNVDWADSSTRPTPSPRQDTGRGPRVRGRGQGPGSTAAPSRGAGRGGRRQQHSPRQTWADGPGAYIPHVQKQLAKEQKDTENRQQFLVPRTNDFPTPSFTDRVTWTSKILPHSMLGPNCKALDPIRSQHCCWITCERISEHFVFKLEGEREQDVRAAAERMRHIHAQAEAKRFQTDTVYIMDVADGLDLPHVRIQDYFGNSRKSIGKLPTFVTPLNPVTFVKDTGSEGMQSFLEEIDSVANASPSHRSYLRPRIHLGRFVMTSYPHDDREFTYARFHELMGEDAMQAFVTDDVGDSKTQSTLLQRISQATHLLNTKDTHSTPDLYAATLKFDDPSKSGHLLVDLELSYDEGSTSIASCSWYRTKCGGEDVRRLLDISMVNLNHGFAWQLEMTAADAVDDLTLPKHYRCLPESLSIDPEGPNFLVIPAKDQRDANVPLKSVLQKRIWRFDTISRYWVVDVVERHEASYVGGKMTREKPKWSLNVVNPDHQLHLKSNAQGKIGEVADWGKTGDPVVELFPPEDEDTGSSDPGSGRSKGLMQLLRLLHGLHDVVVDAPASS